MAKGRAVAIVLKAGEKSELTALTRKHGAPQALPERARIVSRRGRRAQQQGDRGQGGRLCRHGWHMAQSLRGEPDGWSLRRAASWCAARNRRR
jgi:hypothetical protein